MARITRLFNMIIKSVGLVDNPAIAQPFTEVKRAIPFREYPLAPKDREWDGDAAVGRMRIAAGARSESDPSGIDFALYALGFSWFDEDALENLDSYKLPHHDVIGGELHTVFRGTSAALAALDGARGGVDIPESDIPAVRRHLDAHLAEFEESQRASKKTNGEEQNMKKEEVEALFKSLLEPVTAQLKAIEAKSAEQGKSVQEAVQKLTEGMKSVNELKPAIEAVKAAEEGSKTVAEDIKGAKKRLEDLIEDAGERFEAIEKSVEKLGHGKSQKLNGQNEPDLKSGTKWPSFKKAFGA